ncbi:MAG: hypothetical protein KGH62_03365, partial [Candidatus Micrarchaeota archaeon]|nr:hypothetical protein [Candidatus Micrarchaeota archaeon]
MPDKIVVAVAAIAIIVVVLAIALITTHNHGSPPATTTAEISGPGSKVHITATVNNNASNTINPSNVPSVKNQTNSTLPLVPHNAINSSAAPNFGGGPGQNYL